MRKIAQTSSLFWLALLLLGCCLPFAASPFALAAELDATLQRENAEKGVEQNPIALVDDLGFARRLSLDLTGRIPTGKEIAEYLKWPESERRAKLIERYMQDQGFANRWTAFFADLLRIRSNAEGGTALLAFVHNAIQSDMPYDEMARRLIATNGKSGRTPEVGFILGDDADPMALASSTTQVFMGIRISCAQCHDHPFDKWTREDFYSVAAFFGKTRRRENNLTKTVYTTEDKMMRVMWPPEDESDPDERQPMTPSFPFPFLDESENLSFIERFETLRAEQEAAKSASETSAPSVDDLLAAADSKAKGRLNGNFGDAMKVSVEAKRDIRKIDVNADLFQTSELRQTLAEKITSPRNRFFARLLVNRVWKDLVGTGFVEPVDDFREDNPATHPETLDYLAEEFVASGFSFRWLVNEIVTSDTYARSHVPLDADEMKREQLEKAFLATPMRRMKAEAMYDSIVTAGHLSEPKHLAGQNLRVIKQRVRVPVDPDTQADSGSQASTAAPDIASDSDMNQTPAMQDSMMASAENYGLEKAIELDFGELLTVKEDAPMIEAMEKMSRAEIEAMRMKENPKPKLGMKYVTKIVERTIDDNPQFSSAYRMATPAPAGHFLRLFGQPSRVDLGEDRPENASMRQALMMLNGQLTHEAARVGSLEPVYPMLVGPDQDLTRAVRYTYVEILTRLPTTEEVIEAKQIVAEGSDTMTGFADFRWILLNCNEFRFLP
ncbi:hypothetical protein Pla52o_04940 [Novipirellula galeiformis]|uniref:DUF1549 domain-containing protein n=1 Tax=Novipirellula galeiformis TaxID=2528004 RepID=A0A5C6CT95_9BACT|nr:DUF1553 domain-containing protein [Novipirellula galeiformis]TWU26641.1 hypothetical protein Pla52o_04940 [Novipirellula galeiformis]